MRSKGGDSARRAETKGQKQMQNFSAGIFPAGSVVGPPVGKSRCWVVAVIRRSNRSHLGLWVSAITASTALWLPMPCSVYTAPGCAAAVQVFPLHCSTEIHLPCSCV